MVGASFMVERMVDVTEVIRRHSRTRPAHAARDRRRRPGEYARLMESVGTPNLRIRRDAAVQRIDLGDGSWVDLADGFVAAPHDELGVVQHGTSWQQAEVLRYDQYVPERRLSAALDSGSNPLLRQTELHLEGRYHQRFTGVAAILYRDGADFQGLHSDREMRWLDDTLIAIVVLGDRRPFVLRPRGRWDGAPDRSPPGTLADDVVLMPGQGDVLVMGGRCQRDWLHGIPPAPGASARISLTWRWTSRRGRPDTNPTYGDGRQFSDRPPRPGTRMQRS
jgi:alkylated DNA repair dioxygenase AlkB